MTELEITNISHWVLKYIAQFGEKGGRFICVENSRKELIQLAATKLKINIVSDDDIASVSSSILTAWQTLITE